MFSPAQWAEVELVNRLLQGGDVADKPDTAQTQEAAAAEGATRFRQQLYRLRL